MSSPVTDGAGVSPELISAPRDACGEVMGDEEILRKILRCVSRGGERSSVDSESSSQTALVNRLFLHLSLDLRWETIHSLDPILSQLGRLEAITSGPGQASVIFGEYTRRIRVLVLENGQGESDIFPILSAVRLAARLKSRTPVLSLVQSLILTLPNLSDLHIAFHKTPPPSEAITSLHTETTIYSHVLGSLFSLINPDSLQNLVLRLPERGSAFDEGAFSYIRPFTALSSFSITSPDYQLKIPIFSVVEWLAKLEHLRTLHIDIRSHEDPPASCYALRSNASSIHSLSLSGPFSFIQPTTHVFRDVAMRIKLEVYEVDGDVVDDIEAFIPSLNHPNLVVTFTEYE